MSARCKPGDLAIIVRGESVGALMHVLRYAYHDERGLVWLVKSLSRVRARSAAPIPAPEKEWPPGTEGYVADSAMRPLNGDEVKETQGETIKEPA